MKHIYLIILLTYLVTVILVSFDARIKKQYHYTIGYLFFFMSLYIQGKIIITQESSIFFHLSAGLIAGVLIFFLSLFLTTLSFREIREFGFPFKGIAAYYSSRPMLTINFVITCMVEEFIWRGTIQDHFGNIYLGNPHLSIIITAILFTLIHNKSLKDDILKKLEFFIFSLFLGYAFFAFHSLIFVFLVHLVRNICIAYRDSTAGRLETEKEVSASQDKNGEELEDEFNGRDKKSFQTL